MTELGAYPDTPSLVGDRLVVPMNDLARRVLGLDAATGKLLWVARGAP